VTVFARMLRRSSRNVKNAVENDIRGDNPVLSTMKVDVADGTNAASEEDESDVEDEFWDDDDEDTDKNSADEDSDYGSSKLLTSLSSSLEQLTTR
jgi:hypothetical protein